jgi:hypothetical protein
MTWWKRVLCSVITAGTCTGGYDRQKEHAPASAGACGGSQMCVLAVLAWLLAPAIPAHAAMLKHYDLASLALIADVIVMAERTGGPDEAAEYRVLRVLAGQGLRTGEAITINQASYDVPAEPESAWTGERLDGPVEPAAILFLLRPEIHAPWSHSHPSWSLVPSGLRVFVGGRAYRFEQWSNPGGYVAVPQTPESEAPHSVAPAVRLDRVELERAIAGAVERAERARAAIAAHDPMQILALLPAEPVDIWKNEWRDGFGFYQDLIAFRGFEALIAAGEIDAALDVHARTRGLRHFAARDVSDSDLLARAESGSAPLPRRIAALSLLDMLPSDDSTPHRLIAIARDADSPPALRAAAIRVLGGESGVLTSDPGWKARRRRLAKEVRSLVRELAPRALGAVHAELIACAVRWKFRHVVPAERAIGASATRRDRIVTYRVVAAPGLVASFKGVTLLRPDGTACNSTPSLESSMSVDEWSGRIDIAHCTEVAQVRVEVRSGGRNRAWTIPVER